MRCISQGRGGFGRVLGECTVGGESIEARLVRAGWAFDFCRNPAAVDGMGRLRPGFKNRDCYSRGRYAALEAEARAAGRGMWQRDGRGALTSLKLARRAEW